MSKLKIITIFGTRPEAIKMAPLIKEIEKNSDTLQNYICVTAQHRQMLDQVLDLFKLKPDFDLNIMKENQNLWSLTSDVLLKTKEIIEEIKPDIILVHGDTTTSMAAALSAFYAHVKVGHVEAGLRTFDKYYPFPEEINRVFVDNISDYHFAPTDKSVENLLNSKVNPNNIYKTGNTVIDALFYTLKNYSKDVDNFNFNPNLKTILLTAHRRENFGEQITNICHAILALVERNKNIQVIYPVHPNPNIRNTVYKILSNKERIHLIAPLEYAQFCVLMQKSHIILTDSGGIQEEAPSLGKPVLVLRDTTERPEALEYGCVKLIGNHVENIIYGVEQLLDNENEYKKMSKAINPYGDGHASKRIVKVLNDI